MIGRINSFIAHKGPSSVNVCEPHAPSACTFVSFRVFCLVLRSYRHSPIEFKTQHVITAAPQKFLASYAIFFCVTNVEVVFVFFVTSQRSDIHNCAF